MVINEFAFIIKKNSITDFEYAEDKYKLQNVKINKVTTTFENA